MRIKINFVAEETRLARDLINILKIVGHAQGLGFMIKTVTLDDRILTSWKIGGLPSDSESEEMRKEYEDLQKERENRRKLG